MSAIIECQNLTKVFSGKKAINHLDLTIPTCATIGLVGPNGAGKTTLFSILCGFLKPTSGTVNILGKSPFHESLKGKIGILPQDTPMMSGISIETQLMLFTRLQGMNKIQARTEAIRVLSLVDISDLANQVPETLSFGQRKRVTIAQALIGQPEIILLDEPTSGLDPVAANQVRKLIKGLNNKNTIIVSSHNLDEIETICSEIILVDKGKIIKHCGISELIEQDECYTFLLDKNLTDEKLSVIGNLDGITTITIDHYEPRRMLIYFKCENPDLLQFKIMETLQIQGVKILEFSRRAALTDKVVDLVNNN